MHKENLQAVIFDYNGVIADTDDFDKKAVRFACEQAGIIPPDDYNKYFGGRTLKSGFAVYLQKLTEGDSSTPKLHKEILPELMAHKLSFDPHYPENIVPYPDTLSFIHMLSGMFRLAMVTGARRVLINMALKKLDLGDTFEIVITAEDYNEGKPHPESYLHAISLLELRPDQTVVIEDHPLGLRAAKTAGAACIAVTQTHPAKTLWEADLIVDSLMDQKVWEWLHRFCTPSSHRL